MEIKTNRLGDAVLSDGTVVSKIHICNICDNLYDPRKAELAKGYSKDVNGILCLSCQDGVKALASKKRALWVQ